MQLRDAIHTDLDLILEIMNDTILNTTTSYDYDPWTKEKLEEWFGNKKEDKMPVLICELDEKPVGYGTYNIFRPKIGYRFSVEHSIYVHKDSRGKGIGRILLEALIKKAREEGYHTMIAGIDASNKGSVEFHKKFGFEEVATFKEVGYKFDRWLDLIFMQLMLNESEE